MNTLELVEILPVRVWIESGMMGERYVMRQHQGEEPFEYCVFNYNYAHTSNAQTMSDATAIAMSLTNERPIECRTRPWSIETVSASKPPHSEKAP